MQNTLLYQATTSDRQQRQKKYDRILKKCTKSDLGVSFAIRKKMYLNDRKRKKTRGARLYIRLSGVDAFLG